MTMDINIPGDRPQEFPASIHEAPNVSDGQFHSADHQANKVKDVPA
jgi:hypothetical protein